MMLYLSFVLVQEQVHRNVFLYRLFGDMHTDMEVEAMPGVWVQGNCLNLFEKSS